MALASSSSVLWGTASGIMPMLVAASLIISLMFLCFGASTRRGFRPDETEAPRSLRYFPGKNLGSPIPPKGGRAPCAHRAGVFEANSGECQPAFAMFLACLAPVLGVLAHFGPEFVGDFDNNLAVLGLIMVSPTLSYAIYRGVSNRIRSAERSPSPFGRPSQRTQKRRFRDRSMRRAVSDYPVSSLGEMGLPSRSTELSPFGPAPPRTPETSRVGGSSGSSSPGSPPSVISRYMGARKGVGWREDTSRVSRRAQSSPIRQARAFRFHSTPLLLMLCLMGPTEVDSVTCFTCNDGVPGCTGVDCPFNVLVRQNTAVVAGTVAPGNPSVLSCVHLLPLRVLRYFPRTTLDMLRVVSTRPAAGTPLDLAALTPEQLITAVNGGSTYLAEALREVARRISAATTQIDIARLSALQSTLASIERVGASIGGAASSAASGALMGAYTFIYYRSTSVTRGDVGVAVAGLIADDNGGDETARHSASMLTARIARPTSSTEFFDSLQIWIMVCAACGLAHVLTSTAFLRDVVYDTILKLKEPWQVAHELFLVYLERVENCADRSLTLFNVFSNGAHDSLMVKAKDRAKRAFTGAWPTNGIFREGGRRPGGEDGEKGGGLRWNGAFNRDKNAKPCITFNMGRHDHPAACLDSKGACRFRHVCDKWVSDKGPGGICGSDKHKRGDCDNPNKCENAVE